VTEAHPRIEVVGCAIDAVTLDDAVRIAEAAIARRETIQHVSINAAKLVKFRYDATLRDAIAGCALATADGQPVVWAAALLGGRLPQRVAGIDLMEALLEAAHRHRYRIFLLGARPHVLERAEHAIRARFPGVVVAGRHHGYFEQRDEAKVVEEIAGSSADLLFVALETPAKELFLARHRDRIAIPFVMGVGGAFDIFAGERRRAPRLLQRLGLEWAYRLVQDPRRLAYRYIVGNSKFVWLVALDFLRVRLRLPVALPGLRDGEIPLREDRP
jgi:N-acetylglucosaminyldiphosphoundecaprenol N-acetyl-beta-D-mannosaminyltransferase